MGNRFVIYTVLVGNYGKILQPEVIDERFDYVMFSNDIIDNPGIWNVQPIPEDVANDRKRLSRYPKTHPVTLLSDYSASLYIDANLQILDNWVYERFLELYDSDAEIAGVKLVLSGRDCIYSHSYDISVRNIEHDYNAIVQIHELNKRGFPEHFGLNENNLIWRRHTDYVRQVDDEWWWWIMNYSYRDQFSYMFCFWKYKVPFYYFLPEGEDTMNSSHFFRYQHDDDKSVKSVKNVRPGLLEYLRNKCRTSSDSAYRQCLEDWIRMSRSSFPRAALFFWGIYAYMRYLPAFAWRKIFR